MHDEKYYQQKPFSPELEAQMHREVELRHVMRLGLGLALLAITWVLVPYLQEALNTIESAQEQVAALDTNWNTVGLAPGQHHTDSEQAERGDIITVQFLVTVPLVIDRDGSIDFYIFDQANYDRFTNGQSASAEREDQDMGSGTVSVDVPRQDTYYVVFDNSDDYFFEPEEELKYRMVIYTTIEIEKEDRMVTAVLYLPSLVLIAVGGYGIWHIRGGSLLASLPVLLPRSLFHEVIEDDGWNKTEAIGEKKELHKAAIESAQKLKKS